MDGGGWSPITVRRWCRRCRFQSGQRMATLGWLSVGMNTTPDTTTTDTPAMPDPRADFARVVQAVGGLIESTTEAELGRSTPCPEFTVKELLEHLVLIPTRAAAVGRGEHWTTTAEEPRDAGWHDASKRKASRASAPCPCACRCPRWSRWWASTGSSSAPAGCRPSNSARERSGLPAEGSHPNRIAGTCRGLATKYGVSTSTIARVVCGKTHSHVSGPVRSSG